METSILNRLPPKIRLIIYREVMVESRIELTLDKPDGGLRPKVTWLRRYDGLARTCRAIREEYLPIHREQQIIVGVSPRFQSVLKEERGREVDLTDLAEFLPEKLAQTLTCIDNVFMPQQKGVSDDERFAWAKKNFPKLRTILFQTPGVTFESSYEFLTFGDHEASEFIEAICQYGLSGFPVLDFTAMALNCSTDEYVAQLLGFSPHLGIQVISCEALIVEGQQVLPVSNSPLGTQWPLSNIKMQFGYFDHSSGLCWVDYDFCGDQDSRFRRLMAK